MSEFIYQTIADFQNGVPFIDLDLIHKPLDEVELCLTGLEPNADYVGLTKAGLRAQYNEYVKAETGNKTNLNLPSGMELTPWYADSYGRIVKASGEKLTVACKHPIFIRKKFINVVTGEQKVELAYKRTLREEWKSVIVSKSAILTASGIPKLGELDIGASSSNARALVSYLLDFEQTNYERIPIEKSVNRFGWVNETEFSPYAEDLAFDSGDSFKELRDSIEPKGSYEKWLEGVKEIRQTATLEAKIALASSFASPLVEKLGSLPFFTHLWGGTGNGKTVALMLAASVWANPQIGKFAKTFNSTAVGLETNAGTLYSMPLILDELQSINDKKDFDKMIYELTEGTGRARGNVVGGLRPTLTWKNCMITSGEQPITQTLSGGGAKNRIIEVPCDLALFQEPQKVIKLVNKNYGHAGRKWIEALTPEVLERMQAYRDETFIQTTKYGYTEKQAMAASVIFTADRFVGELLFDDKGSFWPEEVYPMLQKLEDVSKDVQAYEWLKGWTAQNYHKFDVDSPDIYGFFTGNSTVIIANVLRKACEDNGISLEALVAYLDKLDLLEKDNSGKRSKSIRFSHRKVRCYVLKLDQSDREPN